jgi:hypothetical protein
MTKLFQIVGTVADPGENIPRTVIGTRYATKPETAIGLFVTKHTNMGRAVAVTDAPTECNPANN